MTTNSKKILSQAEISETIRDWTRRRFTSSFTLACSYTYPISLDELFEMIVAAGDDVNVCIPYRRSSYTFFERLVSDCEMLATSGIENKPVLILIFSKRIHFMLRYSCAWGDDLVKICVGVCTETPGLTSALRAILAYSSESDQHNLMEFWRLADVRYPSRKHLCIDTLDSLISTGLLLENECYDKLNMICNYIFDKRWTYDRNWNLPVELSFLLDRVIIGYF